MMGASAGATYLFVSLVEHGHRVIAESGLGRHLQTVDDAPLGQSRILVRRRQRHKAFRATELDARTKRFQRQTFSTVHKSKIELSKSHIAFRIKNTLYTWFDDNDDGASYDERRVDFIGKFIPTRIIGTTWCSSCRSFSSNSGARCARCCVWWRLG